MSCGRHTTRRQAHATRRAKGSHNVRKASHTARRRAGTAQAGIAVSARATHKKVRKISRTRPKAAKATRKPKTVKRRLSAAQLKARNRRHKILSARARAHARAVARAKAYAAVKAAASKRASQRATRSHAKTERLYCRIATRTAATVSTPQQYYYRRLQQAYRTGNRAGIQQAYKGLKAAGPSKASRAGKAARAAKARKG